MSWHIFLMTAGTTCRTVFLDVFYLSDSKGAKTWTLTKVMHLVIKLLYILAY